MRSVTGGRILAPSTEETRQPTPVRVTKLVGRSQADVPVHILGHWVDCECGFRWVAAPPVDQPGNLCPKCQRGPSMFRVGRLQDVRGSARLNLVAK
jgi:hypothetical protein